MTFKAWPMRRLQKSSVSPRLQCALGYSMHIGSCRITSRSLERNDARRTAATEIASAQTIRAATQFISDMKVIGIDVSAKSCCGVPQSRSGLSVSFRAFGVFVYQPTLMARHLVPSWWLPRLLVRVCGLPIQTPRIQVPSLPEWLPVLQRWSFPPTVWH